MPADRSNVRAVRGTDGSSVEFEVTRRLVLVRAGTWEGEPPEPIARLAHPQAAWLAAQLLRLIPGGPR